MTTLVVASLAAIVGFVLGVLFRNRAVELAKREADAARAALAAKIKP